ncbi:MAG: hypothetical protein CBB68_09610 [Rhodospirillaceae bacterium TMED8]|nr:hypothetical protein [Magnetovibrio sp.]OUT50116.1 MAG: hypothetical protein CBB68_09610 [Rhodospirillaceae bacterium TMED8]|tara:strand:- start:645 stop:890 length:246 start_codon:yes stop_codon:yes gene_type:complete
MTNLVSGLFNKDLITDWAKVQERARMYFDANEKDAKFSYNIFCKGGLLIMFEIEHFFCTGLVLARKSTYDQAQSKLRRRCS